MTLERRREIPEGFDRKQIRGTNVSLFIPRTWRMEVSPEDGSYYFGLEKTIPSHRLKTGVVVTPIYEFESSGSISLAEATANIEKYYGAPYELLRSTKMEVRGPVVMSRTRFLYRRPRFITTQTDSGYITETTRVASSHIDLLAVGDPITDTFLQIFFITPSKEWKQNRELADKILGEIEVYPDEVNK